MGGVNVIQLLMNESDWDGVEKFWDSVGITGELTPHV